MSTFARFPARLQEAIVSRLGWTSLRPVQELAGAAILDGKNAVVLAPTAGGKTEASIFPILAGLVERAPEAVGAIYVAPIKALLNNQEDRLGTYAEMVGLESFVWHGDTRQARKTAFTKEPTDVLITTPESLEVMLLSSRVPVKRLFPDLRCVIVDEVHAFAGTDRGAHLMSVLERIVRFTENDVQRIGLSATVGNPEEILRWLQGSSRREGEVVDPPRVSVQRDLGITLKETVIEIGEEATRDGAGKKSLFFCQSRSLSESVGERMRGGDIDVYVHHSSVSLEERQAAEESFHSAQQGAGACIVCTSTLELGIDVGDLDLVFQANAPSTVSSFLQRMGRTGRRAGKNAHTKFFCEEPETVFQAIALVELAKAGWVESVPVQTSCWPVLVHQLFAMALGIGAVSSERCWEQLSRVPDFSGITREEFDRLIAYMLKEEYLFESGGLLSLGDKAERQFGRRNFQKLYSVFSTPQLYRVKTEAGRDLGSLEQSFADRLVEQMSAFLLGGRAWVVDHVNHEDRVVRVEPAPRGAKPSWGGFVPQHLSFELCQKVKAVLTSSEEYPYVAPPASQVLEAQRAEMGAFLRAEGARLQIEAGVVRWWTFAGGRINHTLKYALETQDSWKVVADNFQVRVKGKSIGAYVPPAIETLRRQEFWNSEATRREILDRLPAYRLSKFQDVLPPDLAAEMVGGYLLDFDATARWLAE